MNNKFSSGLWGLALVLLGILFAGNTFDLWDFNLFFDGWWTLFIIVPCTMGIFKNGFNLGSFIGVLIGVVFLLSAQGILSMVVIRKLIGPIILIIIGIRIIYRSFLDKDRVKMGNISKNGFANYYAVFSGNEIKYPYEVFKGANLTAIFGGVGLDLRGAIINSDVVINCRAMFGGINIIVPPNIKVKIVSTPIFGGVSDGRDYIPCEGEHTVYVKAISMFGGIEIK